MAFEINDRPSEPTLKTSGLNAELTRLRKAGLTLPNNPRRAAQAYRSMASVGSKKTRDSFSKINRAGMSRTAENGNIQMGMEKVRHPLDRFNNSQIPFNVGDKEERQKIREMCNTPDAPVWMADYTFKPMGEIQPGEKVLGWITNKSATANARKLTPTTVLAVKRRMAPEIVEITMESGRIIRCTPDHQWAKGVVPPLRNTDRSEYRAAYVGMKLYHVATPTESLTSDKEIYAAGYIAAMIDGEGNWNRNTIVISQSLAYNPAICATIEENLNILGLEYKINDRFMKTNLSEAGTTIRQFILNGTSTRTRQQLVNLYNKCHPTKMTQQRMDDALLTSAFGNQDRVVSIKSLGPGEVISMQTETGNYTAWGFASKNCRIYYATHNLMPLAIDVYTRFPIQGISITSKDPELTRFYEDLFLDQLNYDTFLIDFGREFFTIGEVNSLASYSETLGIWESEQILNPDDLTVSVSPFSKDHRYHLAIPEEIKDIIENMKPRADYEILMREYPEMVAAARKSANMSVDDSATGEGLEVSNVLLSRIINKNGPNDLYGSPHMLRAFTLLNLEEGLYAAQKAVADRLYSPLILAKLGTPDLGDGEPWVPNEDQLQTFTDQMQQAMSADFRFLAYHFGIEIESVFGREAVPRFDQDFDRLESKMLEVWGIGEALISGGDAGAYASSALNSELVTQLMSSYQKYVKLHFKKRVEVIAEAQGHFDYNVSNGVRTPVMEEYLEVDEDGEERVRKRPKLLLPEINFKTINLRDESTERQFIMGLQQAGVPISAKRLLLNTDIEFKDEMDQIQEEQIQLVLADVEAKQRMIQVLTERGMPLPQELRTIQALQQAPPPPPVGVSMPVPNLATNPVNTPTMTTNPMAQQVAMQNAQAMDPSGAAGGQAPAPGAPPAPGGPGAAPTMGGMQQQQPDTQLPQNWISQRPEISDNMRGNMPAQASRTKSSMRHDPLTVGLRNYLSQASVEEVIKERPWTRSLNDRKIED